MAADGLTKVLTFSKVAPGATVHGWWNNATAEVYRLNAWPNVAPGVHASAEVTNVSSRAHGSPTEREVHFDVKNTGTTTVDIDVWAAWWNWTLGPVLESIRAEFNVPAVGGAIVTATGTAALDVAGIRKNGSNVAVQAGDKWHLGSDTKAMTATLLAALAKKGTVAWDVTVGQAFPQWAQSMKAVFKHMPIQQLMGHRSGITDVSTAEGDALADTSKTVTERRRAFAKLVTHREPGTVPGTTYSYQNTNFILAGAMMESVTGKSWESLIKKELFDPLGMTTAGFLAPGPPNEIKQPWGHSDVTGQRVANQGDNPEGLGPAGTVHASLADWAKFMRLHLDGSEGSLTFTSTELTRLHTSFPISATDATRYGCGWIMYDDIGGEALGHDGSNGSWYCSCQVLPHAGVAFLAVSNIGGGPNGKGDAACWEVIAKLREQHFQS